MFKIEEIARGTTRGSAEQRGIIRGTTRKKDFCVFPRPVPRLSALSSVLFCVLVILGIFFTGVGVAKAASLYFSPASGSYQTSKSFSVSVFVSSPDQAMNAASGVISFPEDKLEITSLAKSGSIIGLWVQEPSFSNGAGVINFEGIALNPGFTGSSGKILTINFKVKAAGSAALTFSSGSVLANDGKGTNILASLGGAQFNLSGVAAAPTPEAPPPSAPAAETAAPTTVSGAPSAPKIISTTHPDPNSWYADSNPKFSWLLATGVSAARVLYDKYPASRPTVLYSPPISGKELTNVNDGVWYFHVQFKNSQGWGVVSHFRFQIDTQPPEPFTIKFINGEKTANPTPTILFDTVDQLSGIDHYQLKIGNENFNKVSSGATMASNPYTLPPQQSGKHAVFVQAFDKAGNHTDNIQDFEIMPLEPPQILEYPTTLRSNEFLTVKGKTYPASTVRLTLTPESGKSFWQETKSGKEGNFTLIWDKKLRSGSYQLTAAVVDERGAESNPSEKVEIKVQPASSLISRLGTIDFSAVVLVLAVLFFILALAFFIRYIWLLKKRSIKIPFKTKGGLPQALSLLRRDIKNQIKLLETTRSSRRFLTQEEVRIIKRLNGFLGEAENLVEKEIGHRQKKKNKK
ncbi:MAG: Ig-like domain-containing protein [Patescibacteria group bacterium]